MIKLFGKGLGVFDHPFDTGAAPSLESITRPTINRDTTVRLLGSLDRPDVIKELTAIRPPVVQDSLQSHVQLPTKDIRRNFDLIDLPRPVINTRIRPQLFSADSGHAPFETLFHDFSIEAFPFYNFWTHDERTNDRDERGDRKLEDIPRFIKVTWNIAPDLPDPEIKVRPRPVTHRPIKPVSFAREIEKPQGFVKKGVHFTPEHLQPGGFSKIKGIIANGHMAPGVIEAVVDLPLKNLGSQVHDVRSSDPINHFDEDAFLTNPKFAGISIHELRSQVNQVTNGLAAMSAVVKEGVAADMAMSKEQLVDGKFIMNKARTPGGFMTLTGVHPSSPSLGFSARTAMPAKEMLPDRVMQLANLVSQPPNINVTKDTAQLKVKFFNPSLGGLLDAKKINLMTTPHHVETLTAIAPNIHHLEILANTDFHRRLRHVDPPSLPSPKVKPLEYIGYVLERYRKQPSGVFTKDGPDIDIPSREADFYIDTKVLYGEVYRYRIKAVLRWTRPKDQTINGQDPLVATRFGTHTTPLATHKSSYFTSEWSHTWAYAYCLDDQPPPPPDELTVRPESARRRVVVTFRLPENSQRDISKMRLFRKFRDSNGNDISDWTLIRDEDARNRPIDFAPQNVLFYDDAIPYFQDSGIRVIYAAQTVSRHGEYSVLSEQLCVRLNKEYFTKGEYPVEFVSSPGVRLEYHGAFSVSPNKVTKTQIVMGIEPTRVGKSPGKTRLRVSGRDTLGNMLLDPSRYVVRVQSLDTGETRDFRFETDPLTVQDNVLVSVVDYYVDKQSTSKKNSDNYAKEKKKDDPKDQKKNNNIDRKAKTGEIHPFDKANPLERWKK